MNSLMSLRKSGWHLDISPSFPSKTKPSTSKKRRETSLHSLHLTKSRILHNELQLLLCCFTAFWSNASECFWTACLPWLAISKSLKLPRNMSGSHCSDWYFHLKLLKLKAGRQCLKLRQTLLSTFPTQYRNPIPKITAGVFLLKK